MTIEYPLKDKYKNATMNLHVGLPWWPLLYTVLYLVDGWLE